MRKIIFCFILFISCESPSMKTELLQKINSRYAAEQGDFAVAFRNLQTGDEILINADTVFHAASTMKTPVMIEVFKQAHEGKFKLTDSIPIKNEFKSIMDGSLYSLDPNEDSEKKLYTMIGQKRTIYDLMYDMIIVSSNLATNIIMEFVDAKKVTQTMRDLGASHIEVLRGVEDIKAYRAGRSNTTTARDLMIIYSALSDSVLTDQESTKQMVSILQDQKFDDIIPKHLPSDVIVAHKTGSITGVHHDSGIVFLPDGRKYVLVLLSKNLKDFDAGTRAMADVSKLVYEYVVQ